MPSRTCALHGVEVAADDGELVLEAGKKVEHHVQLLTDITTALGRRSKFPPPCAALVEHELLLKRISRLLGLGRARLEFLQLSLTHDNGCMAGLATRETHSHVWRRTLYTAPALSA